MPLSLSHRYENINSIEMKRLILNALTVSLVFACTPIDRPDDQFPQEIPGQDSGENGVENYTPEIPTDENDTSSPAGIKADGEITINGGLLNIQVTGRSDGSEGLESKTKITVNGGEVFVYAYDDAINVGGDNPVGMEINGGKIFAFADNNDGIDSNGKLWVNGGLVIASGSAVPEEGLDCDFSQNFIVTGGTLIGTGGAAISTSTSSTQRSVIYNGVSAKTGELFVVNDAEGNPILKYEMPRTMNSMAVFFSSPDIKSGGTYTVYSGGTLSGNTVNWNGWFEDGTYAVGTELGTYTSSSINTTV